MFYSALVNKAIDLAYKYHHGQRDKAGVPYIAHVLHVAEQIDDEVTTCAAILHDTLEDTRLTLAELEKEKFPREVVEAVKTLTHHHHTDYFDYIEDVKRNPTARKVKLADLAHNLDSSRFPHPNERQAKRAEKYRKALQILQD